MKESDFQRDLKKEIRKLFPGCIIFKTDANQIRGFPDLLILYRNKWACLECKKSKDASKRALQEHYVSLLNTMSYASFVYPENKQEVMDELQYAFGVRRTPRISKR